MSTFVPDEITPPVREIPYFEDSREHDVPGRGTEKSITRLQGEVIDALTRMDADSIYFVPGKYPTAVGGRLRYGYQINFRYQGIPCQMDCAALPLRSETVERKNRALAQALYLLRDELKAQANALLYRPGTIPFLPYLVGPGGETFTQLVARTQKVPMLGAGE